MPEKHPVMTTKSCAIVIAAGAAWVLAAPALAASTPAGIGTVGIPAADGRLFGHLPYGEASTEQMVVAMPGFGLSAPCLLQPDAAADLTHLLNAANATPGVAHRLRGVSCYRSVAHQWAVFCRGSSPGDACRDAILRARSVGPPGFSEHATGYAIDFGIRPSPDCPDVNACIADTIPGKWLLDHAPDYGFELSFPAGNAQGVTWEPWHWRWVGTSIDKPGAVRARMIFARARTEFPARPVIDAQQPARAASVGPPTDILPAGVY